MTQKTLHKLIGSYIESLGPEVKAVIQKMYDYRYAPRPNGIKPPKGYPADLEKEIIEILSIAMQNRLRFIDYHEHNQFN